MQDIRRCRLGVSLFAQLRPVFDARIYDMYICTKAVQESPLSLFSNWFLDSKFLHTAKDDYKAALTTLDFFTIPAGVTRL